MWKSYFENILNEKAGTGNHDIDTSNINPPDKILNDLHQIVLSRQISIQEVHRALKRAKNGKATGFDSIPSEILQCKNVDTVMCDLFIKCFNTGNIPSIWRQGIITPLPKPGSTNYNKPQFYRGITLACTMYKIYCSILNARLTTWVEELEILQDEQNGFRKSRSCLDHLSSLTSIIESRKSMNQQTFTAFIDFRRAYDGIDRNMLWGKLTRYGLSGKMFTAIKGTYSTVQCCVRVNGLYSEWFRVENGLKQGCLLSSLMFNLYINDLIICVKDLGLGVKIDGTNVSMLCYADDIVLISDPAVKLQTMLDTLNEWCNTWKMDINTDKTKVMHFRSNTSTQSNVQFNIGDKVIATEQKYKYLGLYIDEHLDFDVTVSYVAKSAHRALGLLIAKDKAHGGMPIDIFSQLYDTLVQSVIDYGAGVWGQRYYSKINNVQNRAAKYFLGIHKKASNAAANGDIGWDFPKTRQWVKVSQLWIRLIKMNRNRLTYKIFRWSYNLAIRNIRNWAFTVIKEFTQLNINISINTTITHKMFVSKVKEKTSAICIKEWKLDLERNNAKNGEGGNKLRTYRSFKHNYSMEEYVKYNLSRSSRSAIAKFRTGVAPINIEMGRFRGLAVEDRVCEHCQTKVEDEVHVIIQCPLYTNIREDLLNKVAEIADINTMSDQDMLGFVLSDKRLVKLAAKTCKDILEKRKHIITN